MPGKPGFSFCYKPVYTIEINTKGVVEMRLDKFLKNSRLIKRRTVAKEACDNGRILINSIIAKAGTQVKVGDVLAIKLGQKTMEVKIIKLLEHATKEDADSMYEYM